MGWFFLENVVSCVPKLVHNKPIQILNSYKINYKGKHYGIDVKLHQAKLKHYIFQLMQTEMHSNIISHYTTGWTDTYVTLT